jgi:polyhydroxyalkanoate synthesis regulator phasin
MAQNDLLKRYLDAGIAFTAMTQARAEAIVKDFHRAGEVQADQMRDLVNELVDRSRRNSDRLVETIRTEVRDQIKALNVATRSELERLEQRIASATGRSSARSAKKSTAKKSAAKKSTAKKSAAKKSTAKRSTAKKSAAKKSAAKKSTAKRSTAKKSAAKKSAAKKSAAKKSSS